MALDLSGMLTELYARGFSGLNDGGAGVTRATRWVNDAAKEIDRMDRWPYRMATTTGTTPLTISDLGEVEKVSDSNHNVLVPSTRSALTDEYGDLTSSGTASYFYMNGSALTAYPSTTLTLTVNYWRVSPDMTADADTPLMPDQFRYAIVERACAKAYRDEDNPDMALVCKAEADDIVNQMREFYGLLTGGDRVLVTFASDDW